MIDTTDGYIPVPDVITRECGPIAATVWGVVWDYCQTAEGVCRASQADIARRAGLPRATVNRHLRTLVQAGYLTELSPNAEGCAQAYADSGRIRLARLDQIGLYAPAPGPARRTKTAGRASSPAPDSSSL